MEAFTDTLPVVCNGFMYGSIYRHFTNSVQWLYVWKHLQTLYQCCAWALIHASDNYCIIYLILKYLLSFTEVK